MITLKDIASATFSIRIRPVTAEEIRDYDESSLRAEQRLGLGVVYLTLNDQGILEAKPETYKQKMESHFKKVHAYIDRPALSGVIQCKDRSLHEGEDEIFRQTWDTIRSAPDFLVYTEDENRADVQMHAVNVANLTKIYGASAKRTILHDAQGIVTLIAMNVDTFVETAHAKGFSFKPVENIPAAFRMKC